MIIESFSENDDDIVPLKMMIEIILKGTMFEIVPLEIMIKIIFLGIMMTSFSKNDD